ncbi:Hsp70 family protein [Micromonospora musae]|uniref:Hsp70 family protein n=1 Tax=Micromonospora musae TaxID=1894970 RepID=A0ABX9RC98_9ACTN|nr:Hsp70 family protein [Micromonospora musae]RKN21127.1 Hsp70 family protein [Micromonospora musae]
MRDTIDFGIDLGTTNSAIAMVEEDGAVAVIKNNDGWDITPSAVWIPKPGTVHVGRKARERVESDPDNATSEFKLEMGLADAGKDFVKGGLRLTPPQLSAEVLKSLRADAAHHAGSPPDAAVITVPAAFSLNQNKATLEAATLAGFSAACPLVQEPTAAAFAYGFHDADDRAYWMVFDFGGGTFDAAVVSKRDGDLRVLNHAGDPYLGGKLIDWAVVERVLAPAAAEALGLTDFRRDNPAWRGNFAKLKGAAEDGKIQLSRRDAVELMVELTVGDGETETFEYTLRRGELDRIAEPFYARAVNLCRQALADGGLRPDDIDKLLLVGGVTLSPGLRERLADPRDGLGITLDTSLDPTTVVARGAAIFASTVRHPDPPSFQPAADEFGLELAYEPSVTTTTPTVAGRLHASSEVDFTGFGVVLSNPGGQPPFRSGRIAVNAAGAFMAEVDIDEHKVSHFRIELTDRAGVPRKVVPDSLTITHREVEFGGARLTHSLGIQLADRAFAPLLRKGATLPARAREVFRTAAALRRSDGEALVRIPVVQGERNRADRNRQVGMLEIRPVDLRIDLPAGTEVEVTFEVDASNLITVVADVPLIQTQFDAEINLDDVRAPKADDLVKTLGEVEGRVDTLRQSHAAQTPEVRDRLDQLSAEGTLTTAREQVRAAAVDTGAAATAEDRLREVQAQLDDIEEAADRPAMVQELRELLAEAADLAARAGQQADRQEHAELERRAEDAIASGSSARIRAEIDRVTGYLIDLQRRQPGWSVQVFYWLGEQQHRMQPAGEAARLVQEGREALAANDERALDAVNSRLVRLLPDGEQNKIIGLTLR